MSAYTCSLLCTCLWSVCAHIPCVIVCVCGCTRVYRAYVCKTLGRVRREGSGHFCSERPLASQGRPCCLGPPAASGSAAAHQARPGPRLCRCSQGGCLSLREAETTGSRPGLGGFAHFHVKCFCSKPQEAALRVLHSFIQWRYFIPTCQLPFQGPKETWVPESLRQVPVCARREGALRSAQDCRPGQFLAQTPCLRQLCRAGVEGDTPVWGPRAAGHAAAQGTEAWQRPGLGSRATGGSELSALSPGPANFLPRSAPRRCAPPPAGGACDGPALSPPSIRAASRFLAPSVFAPLGSENC